jgi:hypothetical protein
MTNPRTADLAVADLPVTNSPVADPPPPTGPTPMTAEHGAQVTAR